VQPDGQLTQINQDCQQLFFAATIFLKEQPPETKLLSQKGLAFYHKQFDVVKIKITTK
jgi:hypothetical protein